MEAFARSMGDLARSVDSWLTSLVRSKTADDGRPEPGEPCAVVVVVSPQRSIRIALTTEGDGAEVEALNQDMQSVFGDFLTAFGKAKSEVENGQQSCSV